MAANATYEVSPLIDGMWLIRLAGDSQREVADSREQAVARARQLVHRTGRGRVVVRAADGKVEGEYVLDEPPSARGHGR